MLWCLTCFPFTLCFPFAEMKRAKQKAEREAKEAKKAKRAKKAKKGKNKASNAICYDRLRIGDTLVRKTLEKRNIANTIRLLKAVRDDDAFVTVVLVDAEKGEVTLKRELGGDLYEWIQNQANFSSKHDRKHVLRSLQFVLNVAEGLQRLHEQHKVAHMDVSLENILLDQTETRAVLCDLEYAVALRKSQRPDITCPYGKVCYMAPEVYLGRLQTCDVAKADVFSLGAVLFALVHFMPFTSANNPRGAHSLLEKGGVRRLLQEYSVSGGAEAPLLKRTVSLLEAMMAHDPEARHSMREVAEDIRTIFLKEHFRSE